MAVRKGTNPYKEVDNMFNKGNSALYKDIKERTHIKNELKNEDMRKSVMDFIFSGKQDEESPLAEVRKNI